MRLVDDKKQDPRSDFRSISKIDIEPGELRTAPPFLIELDEDIAEVFVDSDAVNVTLRPLVRLIKSEARQLANKATDELESAPTVEDNS